MRHGWPFSCTVKLTRSLRKCPSETLGKQDLMINGYSKTYVCTKPIMETLVFNVASKEDTMIIIMIHNPVHNISVSVRM